MTSNYTILSEDDKKHIQRNDLKNISIFVERGLTIDKNELPSYPKNSIFIDGVFDGPPFLDNENMKYSLDHHKGVVRAFTLATCEQILLMLYKGLNLSDGNWRIYCNEPDTDTVLTSWIMLNHDKIFNKELDILTDVTKLVRVEGLIDSHGFTVFDFLGYNEDAIEVETQKLGKITAEEHRIKKDGAWGEIDFSSFLISSLDKLDEVFLKKPFNQTAPNLSEIKTLQIGGGNLIKICSGPGSVHEVELELKQTYGNKLAVIILKKDEKSFALKLSNEFIGKNLIPFYDELNRLEGTHTLIQENSKWSGSDSIGGSPRPNGTALSLDEIAGAAQKIFGQKRGFWRKWLR